MKKRKFLAPLCSGKPVLGEQVPEVDDESRKGFPLRKRLVLGRLPQNQHQIASTSTSQRQPAQHGNEPQKSYFRILYTKRNPLKKRKNKKFNDGILALETTTRHVILFDDSGKQVTTDRLKSAAVEDGAELVVGTFEVEVEQEITQESFRSGRCFLGDSADDAAPATSHLTAAFRARRSALTHTPKNTHLHPPLAPVVSTEASGRTTAAGLGLRKPSASTGLAGQDSEAVVLNRGRPDGTQVILDQFLTRRMRPHQVDGVRFLYECVMGCRDDAHHGALIADQMGLGKTLQVIALLWTLLRQGPSGRPVARKAIVVCPATLTANWADEVRKWLGNERLTPMVLSSNGEEAKEQVDTFRVSPRFPILIASYESVRRHAKGLSGLCQVLVCDEAHRLKSAAGNKTISALLSLGIPRRILLTGTPVQNDLSELFSMVDFALPGLLGSPSAFNQVFGSAISRARDRDASQEERELGRAREAELAGRLEKFLLRRGHEVNKAYLCTLTTYAVFIRPSPLQLDAYSSLLSSKRLTDVLAAAGGASADPADALSLLSTLRKICIHPALLDREGDSDRAGPAGLKESSTGDGANGPTEPLSTGNAASGKMDALRMMLETVRDSPDTTDKMVVCSNSTRALDIVQSLCASLQLPACRIDGKTPVQRRQEIVREFNTLNVSRVCLLSSQAGGAGLNLIGANRLVLLDPHWNPALDHQAMARIWRDGQRKPCVVYRFFLTGTLDERVYMRQLRKGELASVAGAPRSARGGASSNRFTADELRELFTLDRDTACSTRDVLSPVGPGGRREGGSWAKGGEAGGQQGDDWDDVSAWVVDEPLRRVIDSGVCTFVMEAKEGAKVGAGEEGAREEGERVEGAGRRDGRGEGLGEEEGKGSGNEERGEMEGGDEGARGVVRAVQRDGSAQVEGCKLGMQEAGRGRAAAASADSGGSGANAPVRRLKRVRVAAGVGPDNVELHDSLPASGSAAARADDVDELQLEDW